MEATLRDFLDQAPVFLRRPDGEILYWTDGCRAFYGYTREEAEGRISHELLDTKFPEEYSSLQAALSAQGEWTGRLQQTTKDGRVFWMASTWRIRSGTEPSGPIVIEQNTDITSFVELEQQRAILTRELEHRFKNLLAVVQSLARNSFPTAPAEERKKFEERLLALAEANRRLHETSSNEAGLRQILSETARTLGIEQRLRLTGSDVTISADHVIGFGLAVHELCTNAVKHGALSVPNGWVEVSWTGEPNGRHVAVRWEERGGPSPRPPSRSGFGTRLIRNAVASQIGSPVELRFDPAGLVCEMRLVCAGDPG